MEHKNIATIRAKHDVVLFGMTLALALALFFVLLLLIWLALRGDVL